MPLSVFWHEADADSRRLYETAARWHVERSLLLEASRSRKRPLEFHWLVARRLEVEAKCLLRRVRRAKEADDGPSPDELHVRVRLAHREVGSPLKGVLFPRTLEVAGDEHGDCLVLPEFLAIDRLARDAHLHLPLVLRRDCAFDFPVRRPSLATVADARLVHRVVARAVEVAEILEEDRLSVGALRVRAEKDLKGIVENYVDVALGVAELAYRLLARSKRRAHRDINVVLIPRNPKGGAAITHHPILAAQGVEIQALLPKCVVKLAVNYRFFLRIRCLHHRRPVVGGKPRRRLTRQPRRGNRGGDHCNYLCSLSHFHFPITFVRLLSPSPYSLLKAPSFQL